ncbi:TonB-dependent Receptor Plug Domain [Tenacibaculum sp. MAR_2009_124]|uniref:TonB-dependent receptor n=1 Tax=Tenacibaculum sp. MAR_2009_124 TaxID=1250059 RepID=UPI000895462E|nr:TonB-dependent receptor [Tenacibaculum sp. MAR_2009_124]SEB46468.1 TonB-dependent Receptor Plug Domain [Tenacibaculum sp. MAR_2009_124]
MKVIKFLTFMICSISFAQTGTIKGRILDKQSEISLLGVAVELIDTSTKIGTITDENGYFVLENVPLGRQVVRITYLGYDTVTIPNIVVTAGKSAFVNASLLESFAQLDEVVLVSKPNKRQAVNKLAAVSARQISLEEVNRFSGGRSDVGRLAANFAGVSAPDDSRNDIVIRGNSPTGLLWRLEGVPIPSPNHFSTAGTTGSPVSALNTNMLKNSDFITSAFPAEYGNAIGGVLDLGFRKGNIDTYEFTAQMGVFTGVEAMAEGPLGKKQGSFLVAARYSLTGLLGVGGAGGTSAIPNYSDVSFNVDFGSGKFGNLSLFGIIGNSDIDFLGDDVDDTDLFAAEDEDAFNTSGFSVIGLKHKIATGDRSYLKSSVTFSSSSNIYEADRYIDKNTDQERVIRFTEVDNSENRITFSSLYNTKLNKKATLRVGMLVESFNVKSFLKDRDKQADNNNDGDPDFFTFRDIDDDFLLFQPYIQGQYRLTDKITFNAGLHSQYSSLNEQFVIEPRASVNYKIARKHAVSFGYGIHHQNVALPLLFLNESVNGSLVQTNRDLDFTRSEHYVLGYDLNIGRNWRAKIEAYRQDITKAAVDNFPSSYSSLTEGADFSFNNNRVSLVNEGTGFNHGLELTVEKFFSNSYYGLLTTSIFESKYAGSDGVERNTPFNNGYVFNLLAGKEFKIGKEKTNLLFVDTRFTMAGGRYYTPIDLLASKTAGFEVLQEDAAYSLQYDDYLRLDFKFGIKLNSKTKKRSHQFYVDLQNVLDTKNIFTKRYNRLTNNIDQVDQIGFFPDVGYKFQF